MRIPVSLDLFSGLRWSGSRWVKIDPGLLQHKFVCVSSVRGFLLGDPLDAMALGKLPWLITAQVGMHVQYQWIYFRGSVGHDAAGSVTLAYYRTSWYACTISVDLF